MKEKCQMINIKNNAETPNDLPNGFIITSTIPLDTKALDFLPPELRSLIQKDLINGSNGAIPSEAPVEEKPVVKKIKFDYKMVNTSQDLKELTKKLKKSKKKNFGILLYGVSGSGKSHYGKLLAQELKMPYIKKKASDLIDKFVGQTEQNIRDAFQQAKKAKAILLIDEADSFLFDRTKAQRDFECASVNEILVQMEEHPYPFIMTTNLKDKLDSACIRRILFKIKYDYMTKDNIKAGIKTYFGKSFKLKEEELDKLKYITAGDFKIAKDKMDILDDGNYTNELIFQYLLKEQEEKNIKEGSNPIVF